jgi:DNA-directed RNA polymerase subunit RPC12/RpoP
MTKYKCVKCGRIYTGWVGKSKCSTLSCEGNLEQIKEENEVQQYKR